MNIIKMEILSSEPTIMPDGQAGWKVVTLLSLADGRKIRIPHFFAHQCFAARAAEYGIDPDQVDTLLDIILLENYILNQDVDIKFTVYGSASTEDTRIAHIRRCAQVKLRHKVSTRSNKSTLKAKALNPDDPTTMDQVEADHPLANVRNHLSDNPILVEHVADIKRSFDRARVEMGVV